MRLPDGPTSPSAAFPRVLLVDDEPAILDGLRRQLGSSFDVATAVGGPEALKLMERSKPFPVVLSDMRMPGLDGATFLTIVRKRFPDTVRMLLTGQSDLESTIAAINGGQIYRYLTKPCPISLLEAALHEAVAVHHRVSGERNALNAVRTALQSLDGHGALLPDGSRPVGSRSLPGAVGAPPYKPGSLTDRLAAIRSAGGSSGGPRAAR
jgi:DNA-binding NtrC family response regulator